MKEGVNYNLTLVKAFISTLYRINYYSYYIYLSIMLVIWYYWCMLTISQTQHRMEKGTLNWWWWWIADNHNCFSHNYQQWWIISDVISWWVSHRCSNTISHCQIYILLLKDSIMPLSSIEYGFIKYYFFTVTICGVAHIP